MAKRWTGYEKASFWVGIALLFIAILGLLFSRPTHQSGNATTKGQNSPAVTGDNNKIEITPLPNSKNTEPEVPKAPNTKEKP